MTAALHDWLGALAGATTVAVAILGWLRWLRPKLRHTLGQVGAVRDSILGREAILDSITGIELAPALPGVGVRLADQERHLGTLAEAVATIAADHHQIADHEGRIVRLEQAAVERVVGKAESVAAWRAMEAAAGATPPEEGKL